MMNRCEKCRQAMNAERLASERQKEILKLKMILTNVAAAESIEQVQQIVADNKVIFENLAVE